MSGSILIKLNNKLGKDSLFNDKWLKVLVEDLVFDIQFVVLKLSKVLVSLARLEKLVKLFTVTSVVLFFLIIIVFLLFFGKQSKVVKDDSDLGEHLLEEVLLVAFLADIRELHDDLVAEVLIVGGCVIDGGVDQGNDGLSVSIWVVE